MDIFLDHQKIQVHLKTPWEGVVRHARHPLRPAARLMSRCLTLLWKHTVAQGDTIAIVGMAEINKVVQNFRDQGSKGVRIELDVKEMFPTLPPLYSRDDRFSHRQNRGGGGTGSQIFFFHIHKGGLRSLDYLTGKAGGCTYWSFRLSDVEISLEYKLNPNDSFVHWV